VSHPGKYLVLPSSPHRERSRLWWARDAAEAVSPRWSRIYVPNSEHRVAFIRLRADPVSVIVAPRRPYQRTRTTTSRTRLGTLTTDRGSLVKKFTEPFFPGLVFFVLRAGDKRPAAPQRSLMSIQAPSRWLSGTPSAHQGRRTMPLGMVEKSPDFIQTRGF